MDIFDLDEDYQPEHHEPAPEPKVFAIDFKSQLNPEQYEAVTAPIGPVLVLAGAGSGKTRTLTYRVAYLLSNGIKPWEILLLTFTNKAAREMLERVEQLTGVEAHKFWGGTFHHIGQKLLRMYGESIGVQKSFNIIDAGDAEALLSEVINTADKDFLKSKDNPKAKVIAEIISFTRNTCASLDSVIKEKYPFFGYISDKIKLFAKHYTEQKRKQQVLDYDDLLELWLEMLEKDPNVRAECQNRFRYLLVDEYQDTNILQSKIVDLMTSNHHVMAVGDDAQCIYTWRGANFENIMTFPKRHPGTKICKIVTNYRSSPQILEFANRVLENQPADAGYSKELKAVKPSRSKPQFSVLADTRHQAQFVLQRIKGLLSEGYQYRDIAILYRAHYQAMDLQMELTRAGIPYQITSGVRFFEQAHIKDVVALLRFAINPMDSTAFLRFITLLPKVGPKSAERVLKSAQETAVKKNITIFKALEDDSIAKKVPEAVRDDYLDIVYTLQDVSDGVNKIEPRELVKIAVTGWYSDYMRNIYTNWMSRQDDLDSLISFADRFDSVSDLLAQLVLMSSETTDKGVELDENSLRLTTIHQAKGLEYPVVFVIGLSETMFPLKRAVEEDNIDEERRLFYVAVTRAMEELYLAHPRMGALGGPPILLEACRFIREVDEDYYDSLTIPLRKSYY